MTNHIYSLKVCTFAILKYRQDKQSKQIENTLILENPLRQ